MTETLHAKHTRDIRATPTVACVMLTRDRPEMTERAVRSFAQQTYRNKWLTVFDTGDDSAGYLHDTDNLSHHWAGLCWQESTIGSLRNEAIDRTKADIIIHMDSDDVSGPRRIEEQVATLIASGRDCVGYNQAFFWDARWKDDGNPYGNQEAWIYANPRYILGASFCFWRSAWEKRPFEDCNNEDYVWQTGNHRNMLGVSGLADHRVDTQTLCDGEPRLVCCIHGANSSPAYRKLNPPEWTRHSEYDTKLARIMVL